MDDRTGEGLTFAMLIVTRCRQEGRDAKAAGVPALSCPYGEAQGLERAGWLDGWSKA
jgi:hypothetical protein